MPLDSLLASLRPGGRDFERVCMWTLENVPEYRQTLRQVWLWDDRPGRWGRGADIDLVAEDRDGGLWAVQAKHYDPRPMRSRGRPRFVPERTARAFV